MKVTRSPAAVPVPPAADNRSTSAPSPSSAGARTAVQSPSLGDVAERLKTSSEVDMDKVGAVRQAIAEGRLPMDLDRLAEAVLDLHRR